MGKWQTSWINDSGRKEEGWSEARGQVCSLRHFACINRPRPELKMLSAQSPGFPLGLENLGKWEGIFQSGKSQGILNRLEKSGKTTQNTGKLR